ncbi:MAG: nuclear transport factor 2 family protein, partial [Sediminibacterium sp.]|nr:nuclear transport factor 2 family protein [Sediminibacterium sp.]
KNNFIQNILLKKSVFLNIQLNDQTIDIINKTAIVRHHFTATTNDNGVSNIVHLKVLLVFIKEKNNWVLIARQSIKI